MAGTSRGRFENPADVPSRRANKRPYRGTMKRPRFSCEPRQAAGSHPRLQKNLRLKWIPVSHIGERLFRNSASKRRKRIFAVIAPLLPADSSRTPIRRILIFDNHPDSLRLVSRQYLNGDAQSPTLRPLYRDVILGLLLILLLVCAMFWPLLLS